MVIDRLKAVVNLDYLVENYQALKRLNQGKDIYAVVKADAYGHGAIECSLHLEKNGCKHFAVTILKEAIELRNAGLKSEILIFGKTDPLNAMYLYDYDLVQTVYSYEYACELNRLGKKIKVHLNIDTGMSRLGFLCQRDKDILPVVEKIEKISKLENIEICGIYSHFTSADSDLNFTYEQKRLFNLLLKELIIRQINYGKVHLDNSAGVITLEDGDYDLARCGIAMYGYPPVKSEEAFLPVMSLFAKVISIREIEAGASVSYGRTFVAKSKMTIATIAIGYADGYMRILSNNDFVYYQGYELPVVGRICMELTMLNVTGVSIKEGDEVEVFGRNKLLEPMAKRALTITYELLTNLAKPRVDKIYIKK